MRPQLNEVAIIYVQRNTSKLDGSQVIVTQRKVDLGRELSRHKGGLINFCGKENLVAIT